MKESIHIHWLNPKYKVDEKKGIVCCTQSVEIKLFDEIKYFYGKGQSDRMLGNVFTEEFGQSMSYIRAVQNVAKKIEMFHVKYSMTHMLESEEPTDYLSDVIFGNIMPGDWVIR